MRNMRRELVFTAYPRRAEPARRITLAEAGLKERSDLQEWIRAHPQILGSDVRIVTYEFDRWVSGAGNHGDRLDLLGLDQDGRLVLAELKRDGAPDTIEMQAIKYASYASKFKVEILAACHAHYLRRTLSDADISDEDALAQLDEHCGGLDPDQLAAVRIVLVAGSFPAPVTSAVVWLCSQGLDITLIEIRAYQCDHDVVVTVSQLWPLPEVDDLTVSPVAPTLIATRGAARRRTAPNAVASLAESGALPDDTELHLVPAGGHAAQVSQWVNERPERGRAIWRTGERVRALEWTVDSDRYSASGLAEHIFKESTGRDASIAGPEWWALEDGKRSPSWPARQRRAGVTGRRCTSCCTSSSPGSGPPPETSLTRSGPPQSRWGNTCPSATTARTPTGSSARRGGPVRTSPGATLRKHGRAGKYSRAKG